MKTNLIKKITKATELDETDVIAGIAFVMCLVIFFGAILLNNG